mmetsp:Transcript_31122/g.54106  ORF Transcript_31122/g.54106 Transcript_31122/m.54106 type:complete len:86 (-) Transcript_31122:181-438(-)
MRNSRSNGFNCPLHWQQISSWVLTALQVILASAFVVPLLPDLLKSLFCISFYLPQLGAIWLAYLATKRDPTDSLVKENRGTNFKG